MIEHINPHYCPSLVALSVFPFIANQSMHFPFLSTYSHISWGTGIRGHDEYLYSASRSASNALIVPEHIKLHYCPSLVAWSVSPFTEINQCTFPFYFHILISAGVPASEGMTTIPQGNQELLVVRDKVGRPQVSLG